MTREIPLLCTDEVVRAYLSGRKTQSRRPIKWAVNQCGEPADHLCEIGTSGRWIAWWGPASQEACQQLTDRAYHPRYGRKGLCRPGDHAWIRECWRITSDHEAPYSGLAIEYRADRATRYLEFSEYEHASKWVDEAARWHPNQHMPRWACRLTRPIINVRVEPVRDISETDAIAEGVTPDAAALDDAFPHAFAYAELWTKLYGAKHPWSTAWCWVIETEPYRPSS